MSVDHCPTCPDCGDDLVYDPQKPTTTGLAGENSTYLFGYIYRGAWKCPDCNKRFDIPDYAPEDLDPEKH